MPDEPRDDIDKLIVAVDEDIADIASTGAPAGTVCAARPGRDATMPPGGGGIVHWRMLANWEKAIPRRSTAQVHLQRQCGRRWYWVNASSPRASAPVLEANVCSL